jgi:hypothetical protein
MAGRISVTQGETGVTMCFCSVVMVSVVARARTRRHVNVVVVGKRQRASRREAASLAHAQGGRNVHDKQGTCRN